MEIKFDAELVKDEIIADMHKKFHLNIHSVESIDWNNGNDCFIMRTDNGPLFVKRFGRARNKGESIDVARRALKYQDQMHSSGIPCQPVFSYKGEYIHTTGSGDQYAVSGASEGRHIEAGSANTLQMFSLGDATGRMHDWMRENMPKNVSVY